MPHTAMIDAKRATSRGGKIVDGVFFTIVNLSHAVAENRVIELAARGRGMSGGDLPKWPCWFRGARTSACGQRAAVTGRLASSKAALAELQKAISAWSLTTFWSGFWPE
jgi:hypothetical protein